MDKLNWAVLGTGVVANQMAQAMQGVGVQTLRCRQQKRTAKPLILLINTALKRCMTI